MYTREVYPGSHQVLLHYDGPDKGQQWPQAAPAGLAIAGGFSLLNDGGFHGPDDKVTALTSPEATVLANMGAGLGHKNIAARYNNWFNFHDTRQSLLYKLGVPSLARPDEAAIAAGHQYGAYLPETLPSLSSVRHDHQKTVLQLGRLFATGRSYSSISTHIGFSEDKMSYVCKQALADLGLSPVERHSYAVVMLAGVSKTLLYPGQANNPDSLLQPLPAEEIARIFPTLTRIEYPIIEEPSTAVYLAGQHLDSEEPDWSRGNITQFVYRDARFDVHNDPEVTGIKSKEMAAWILRCLGLSYNDTVEMFGSKAALEGAYKKLSTAANTSNTSCRKHVLEQSVAAARKRGIIVPRTAPYLWGLNQKWKTRLLEFTQLLGEGKQHAQIGEELKPTRGGAVKRERVNQELFRLREILQVTHDGQLMLLGEAERASQASSAAVS